MTSRLSETITPAHLDEIAIVKGFLNSTRAILPILHLRYGASARFKVLFDVVHLREKVYAFLVLAVLLHKKPVVHMRKHEPCEERGSGECIAHL